MEEWIKEEIERGIEGDTGLLLYLYTPLCGTCQVAGKMLTVVESLMPEVNWGKCNLNLIPEYAKEWEVESVPCLVFIRNSEIIEKIYAFHSVPFLYEKIKKMVRADTI